jgi:large subunit ribosomal protein L27
MAHVKSGGATRQAKPRHGKRLGIKKFGGEKVMKGQIIIRQKGTVYRMGKNVGVGRDKTMFAMMDGLVAFSKRLGKTVVNVVAAPGK